MKKTLLIAALMAVACLAQAQRTIWIVDPPTWQGPARFEFGVGVTQRIGQPSMKMWGGQEMSPDAFSSNLSPSFFVNMELDTKDEGFSCGPYFGLWFQPKDGWSADIEGTQINSQNTNFLMHYSMEQKLLSFDVGFNVHYTVGEKLMLGVGVGGYLMKALGTGYAVSYTNKRTGAVTEVENPQGSMMEFSSPFNLGLSAKVSANYFITDGFYVGAQARYDFLPLFCDLDDAYNVLAYDVSVSDDNRPRYTALLTIGIRWMSR